MNKGQDVPQGVPAVGMGHGWDTGGKGVGGGAGGTDMTPAEQDEVGQFNVPSRIQTLYPKRKPSFFVRAITQECPLMMCAVP